MTPDQLRALAEALDEITPVMGLEELHHMETLDRAADYLRACAEERPVAWLHDVVQDGDEPDEALSFYPDSFPLENVGGFRSIGCKPLFSAPAAPQAEPVAIVRVHRTGGNAGIAWSAVPTGAQMMLDGDLLYAAPQAEPKRELSEKQIEARDALLDFISENGTASEGVQHYLDRYVRAALAAKEG